MASRLAWMALAWSAKTKTIGAANGFGGSSTEDRGSLFSRRFNSRDGGPWWCDISASRKAADLWIAGGQGQQRPPGGL